VNNHYVQAGTLAWDRLEGWWTDAGTFESLHAASELVTGRATDARAAER
jgi:glucose-1-phosphate thymidylyltransferase